MAPQDVIPDAHPPKAERRQLTVMFCDLVGSTKMSTQLDPEDLRDVLLRYREVCAREVQLFGGFVAQYLGDGILAYFGYPQANEGDVENCLQAGQAILEKLSEINDPSMQVRLGVATGTVVVGDVIAQHTEERDIAIGPTPNLAARLMALSEPGEIIISDSTQKLAPDLFTYEEIRDINIKGFDGQTTAWRVTGSAKALSLSQAVQNRAHSTPLVGRREEVEQLSALWRKARDGEGQAVLITGEAGMGKSRLAHHFEASLTNTANSPPLVKLYSSEIGRNSTFRPIADHILTKVNSLKQATEAEQAENVHTYLRETIGASEADSALLREFLSLTHSTLAPTGADPESRKAHVFELLERYLCRTSPNQPAILVIEDLHWCDTSTLELLEHLLLKRIADLPILVLLTARPEFLPNWPSGPNISSIQVGRLSKFEAAQLLSHMEAAEALPEEARRQIIERSDSIPLFLEEVCKATSEGLSQMKGKRVRRRRGGDSTPLAAFGVPTSLASSLTARLDRLGAVKEVAQIASIIGQVFSKDALSHLSHTSEANLETALERLVRADIIIPRQKSVEPTYVFKHALMQDAAYSSMLKKERKRLHARLAGLLESELADSSESRPELIARHFARGGLPEDAIENWRLAGDLARGRGANSDAIAHFTNGLELLDELPDDEVTNEIEIDLRTNLALALTAVHGGGSKEVGYNYSKARSLSAYNAESTEHFPIMIGVWNSSFARGDLNGAHSATEEVMRIADRKNDASYAVEANRVRGMTLFYRGDFKGAHDHIMRATAVHDPEFHQQHALRFGLDPLVCCHAYLSYTHLFLGRSAEALAASERAVAEAKRIDHLYSQAFSLAFAALLRVNLEMPEEASRFAQETIDCARESEFQFYVVQQYVVKAWARALVDPDPTAFTQMSERVEAFLESSTSIGATRVMSMMAEVSLRHSRPEDAQAMLSRAVERIHRKGEVYHLAEIHRLQAELTWVAEGPDGASSISSYLTRAIDTAEDQMAAIWIRRITQSTHRLYGLLMGKTAALPGFDVDLDSFTDDEVELAERMAYSRKLIHLIDGGLAA